MILYYLVTETMESKKMKNADLPAMPLPNEVSLTNGKAGEMDGLTKREMFAMHAMQGYLAMCAGEKSPLHDEVARESIYYAEALLEELEK